MKTLILAAIRCSLMFTAVTASLFSVRPAQAYTVTLEQMGSNVVANGSGAINLTGLTFQFSVAVPKATVCVQISGLIDIGDRSGESDVYDWIHRTDEFRERGPFSCQHWQRRPCRN